jgi:hypothetical protein
MCNDATASADSSTNTATPHEPTLRTPHAAGGTYRNRIFHSAYIDIDTYDVDNAFAFIGHLSDVLARVVFHFIGFSGPYL